MKTSSLSDQYYSRLIALERRSPLTAETYGFEIRRFFEWLAGEGLEAASVDAEGVSRYLEFRRTADGIDSRSAAKAISALRSFFRFAMDENIRRDNPAAILEIPRRGMHLPEVLSREKVEEILSVIDTKTPLGLRNRAIYELIYSAGLRVSEAVGINVKDLDFAGGIAKVKGKGNKERLIVFGPEAASWLKRYLAESRPLIAGHRHSPALFIGKSGKRLTRKGIWKNYTRFTAMAGTGSHLHTLRHSFATEMLAGGADLRSVQELLGHADLVTTQIYTHVDVSMLRENHRKFMPKLGGYVSHE
ncbi:tyrosine recombinase XerD [Spirochaetia bacterium]|nr:tyrosine recombinase XerD [Spirochaetia bacterium]